MPCARDFGLHAGFLLCPDTLAALCQYQRALSIAAAKQSVSTGERIPASALRAALIDELDLDERLAEMYLFAGLMIEWDRDLAAMTPQNKQATLEELARFDAEANASQASEHELPATPAWLAQARDEVSALEEWWSWPEADQA